MELLYYKYTLLASAPTTPKYCRNIFALHSTTSWSPSILFLIQTQNTTLQKYRDHSNATIHNSRPANFFFAIYQHAFASTQ